jgi:hypothetical protein
VTGVIAHPPAAGLKPDPTTDTVVPADPEVGERTICGKTIKVGVVVDGVLLGVDLTAIPYPAAAYTDNAPTLKVADSTPLVFTVHDSESMTKPATGVMAHPVSLDGNPVPEIVTRVPSTLPTGGEPLVGVMVTCAWTPNA